MHNEKCDTCAHRRVCTDEMSVDCLREPDNGRYYCKSIHFMEDEPPSPVTPTPRPTPEPRPLVGGESTLVCPMCGIPMICYNDANDLSTRIDWLKCPRCYATAEVLYNRDFTYNKIVWVR